LPGQFQTATLRRRRLHLDYGPFGFCELFEPKFQPLDRRRNEHFSSSNQPVAAEANYQMFWASIDCCSMATPKPWRGWIRSTMASLKR